LVPDSMDTYYNLGILYKNANRLDMAIKIWKKALTINPEETRFRKHIADYYFEKRYFQDALNQYEKYIIANLNRPDKVEDLNYCNLKMGMIYSQMNSAENASHHFKKVISSSKNARHLQKAHLGLALIYVSETKFNPQLARQEAYKGIHYDPENLGARMEFCRVLSGTNSAADREKAIEELTGLSITEQAPELIADAFNLLGLLYYKNGEMKRALMAFQNSLDLDPTNQKAFENQKLVQSKIQ